VSKLGIAEGMVSRSVEFCMPLAIGTILTTLANNAGRAVSVLQQKRLRTTEQLSLRSMAVILLISRAGRRLRYINVPTAHTPKQQRSISGNPKRAQRTCSTLTGDAA